MTELTIPRRQVSILAGASGAGKTTLLIQVLAAWARGESFTPALLFDAKKVAYLVADRTSEEVHIRRTRLGIPEDKMEVYGFVNDKSFNIELLKTPELALNKILDTKFKPGFDLLVIDPLVLFLDGNTNDYRQMAMALIKINRLAIERDITIIAAHHATKMKDDVKFMRVQDRINGSAALQGYSGTQMVLVEGEENGEHIDYLAVIPHMGPKQVVKLTRDEKGEFITINAKDEDASAEGQLYTFLGQFIPGEVIKITQFHAYGDKISIEKRQVFNVIKKFLSNHLLEKTGRGEYCRPVKEDPCPLITKAAEQAL